MSGCPFRWRYKAFTSGALMRAKALSRVPSSGIAPDRQLPLVTSAYLCFAAALLAGYGGLASAGIVAGVILVVAAIARRDARFGALGLLTLGGVVIALVSAVPSRRLTREDASPSCARAITLRSGARERGRLDLSMQSFAAMLQWRRRFLSPTSIESRRK
jgi:hypothetical protein